MDKRTALNALSLFRQNLEAQSIHDPQIVLFGSYAKGTPREDSDIDVVVISKSFQGKDFWARIDILTIAIYKSSRYIEATALTPEEWEKKELMITHYAKDGEMIEC